MERFDVRAFRASLLWAPLFVAFLVLAPRLPAHAELRPHYASIVMDAETGKVLTETNADAPHYPASLTKMMTLYLVFDALDKGWLRIDERLPVSDDAANQSPTKLGLQPGDTIAVRDLILGLVTRSANDAAVVAAESIAGSEAAFAERMTQKARALGMSNTTFRNASGLPDPRQVTTARDLAKLARALYRDFPEKYHYFATEEFTYRGEVITTHNHLMKSFAGMDGIKTGFIRASGFNLAASAVRNNWRLIGIVVGGPTAHARDIKMAALLNDAFARHQAPSEIEVADTPEAPASDSSFTFRAARTLRNLSPVSRAEAAQLSPPRAHHGAARESWSIQVGAFSQRSAATKAATTALAKLVPGSRHKAIEVLAPSRAAKEAYYRARILNFSAKEAEQACRTLHRLHRDCAPIAPSAISIARS